MGTRAALLKRAAAALAAAALALLLLAAYAAPRTGLPWSGSTTPLPAAHFVGGVPGADGSLRIERAAGDDQHLLRFSSTDVLRGRYLTYRFDHVPATLRLAVGWSVDDTGWRWAPLPFPEGRMTVDLARLSPDWSGEADTIAFALLPAEMLPAAAVPTLPLTLHSVELSTDARLPALAALLDEWRAYRQWSGRSINTSGFDLRLDPPLPVQGFVLLLLAAAALVLAAALARRRARAGRVARIAIGLLALGWVMLDLVQLRIASQRAGHLGTLHRTAEGALAVDPQLARALADLSARTELASPGSRLVVFAATPFLQSWPVFALLPMDAASLPVEALGQLQRGALVLRLGEAGDLADGTLRSSSHQARVRVLEEQPGLALLELMDPPEPLP